MDPQGDPGLNNLKVNLVQRAGHDLLSRKVENSILPQVIEELIKSFET